jgi:hypothetical protein
MQSFSSSAAAAPASFRPPLMTCRAAKPSGSAKAFDFDIAFDGSGSNSGANGSATATTGMDRCPDSTTTSDLFLAPEKTFSSYTPRGLEGKGEFMRKGDGGDNGEHGGGGFHTSAKLGGCFYSLSL